MRNLAVAAAIVLTATTLHAQESELKFKERPDSGEVDLKFPADDPNAINEVFEEINVERADDAIVVSTARTQYAQAVNDEGKDRIQVQTDKDVAVIRVDRTVPLRELMEQIEKIRAENPDIAIAIENTAATEYEEDSYRVIQPGRTEVSEQVEIVSVGEGDEMQFFANDMAELVKISLENNPEIEAVRAELAAAQARLKQIELRTASELVRRQRELKDLEERRKMLEKRVDLGTETSEALIDIDARIQDNKSQLRYLLGDNSWNPDSGTPEHIRVRGELLLSDDAKRRLHRVSTMPRPSLADVHTNSISGKLDEETGLDFDDTSIAEVCRHLTEFFEINFNVDVVARDIPITIHLRKVPLKSVLLAIAEANQLAFIVRDYGIFVTTQDRVHNIPGPSIPEDLPYRKDNVYIPTKNLRPTTDSQDIHGIPLLSEIPLLGELFRGKADQADRARHLLEVIEHEGEGSIEYDVDGDGTKEEVIIKKKP